MHVVTPIGEKTQSESSIDGSLCATLSVSGPGKISAGSRMLKGNQPERAARGRGAVSPP